MGHYTRDDVYAVDIQALSDRLQAALVALGYTVKAGSYPDEYDHHSKGKLLSTGLRWSASHDRRGVKVSAVFANLYDGNILQMDGKSLQVSSRTRTARDTYKKASHDGYHIKIGHPKYGTYDHDQWFARVVNELTTAQGETVTNPIIRSKSALADFPPFRFDRPAYVPEPTSHLGRKVVGMRAFFKSCAVKGAASILPTLRVSIDEAAKPGAEPWFYVKGDIWAKRSGAIGEMVVSITEDDGLVYYPVRNGRVTNIMKVENTYVDFEQISELDEEIVRRAIEAFLE